MLYERKVFMDSTDIILIVLLIIGFIWFVIFYIQIFLGLGTAYRYTKRNGDSGVALFGWLILFYLAAVIPGLGIHLWSKSKKTSIYYQQQYHQQAPYPAQPPYAPPRQTQGNNRGQY